MIDAGAADSFPGNSALLKFKQKITGTKGTTGTDGTKNVEIIVPLKYLSYFWRTFKMPLITCEINIILTWSENSIISNAAPNQTTKFAINDTKLHVPVVTLSTEDNAKILQQLNNLTTQASNRYLDYLIDPSFQGVNRLFVLAFFINAKRLAYARYYLPTIKIENIML